MSIAAFRRSLEIRTKKAIPHWYAETQNALAATLCSYAKISSGCAQRLYTEAESAFEETLSIHTKDAQPLLWARTVANFAQSVLGLADLEQDVERADLVIDLMHQSLKILS